jgi:hypothetical protein
MRSRNLKPGFFTNELLAECPPLARLLFAGLWCVADRRGLLEDRPRRLKIELLPYDDCDVDTLLTILHERGFILRYTNPDGRYIWIRNFAAHQHPHQNERPNQIAPPEGYGCTPRVAPEGNRINRADSLLPLTDSLLLIPENDVPDSGADDPPAASPAATAAASGDDLAPATIELIAETLAGAPFIGDGLPDIERAVRRSFRLTPGFDPADGAREAELFARWRGYAKRPPQDWYRAWLNWIKRSVEQSQAHQRERSNQTTDDDRRRHRERHLAMGVFNASTGRSEGGS